MPARHRRQEPSDAVSRLPRPQPVGADGAAPPQRSAPPPPVQPQPAAVAQGDEDHDVVGTAAAATWLSWGVSLTFHCGLFVILYFIVWTLSQGTSEDVIIPIATLSDTPGTEFTVEQSETLETAQASEVAQPEYTNQQSAAISAEAIETEISLIGIGSSPLTGSSLNSIGVKSGGPDGPASKFFGTGGNARKICFVVDRSGSMLDSFDFVKRELKQSIRDLQPVQSFHVMFFSAGEPLEYPAKRLVSATVQNKEKVYKWIDNVVNQGQTNPEKALMRAIKLKPELVYFLTDGDFDRKIIFTLRRVNEDKRVKINAIAFVHRPAEIRLQ